MKTKSGSGYFPYIVLTMFIVIAGYIAYKSLVPAKSLPVIKAAPDFVLEDLKGNSFKSESMNGTVRLMEFMFTSCPDICPVTTYKMVQIQEEMKTRGIWGEQVKMIAISFDPTRDTPEVFNAYAERMNIDRSGWALLRGDEKNIQQIAKQYGVTIQNMGDGQFVHNVTSLMLIDGKDRIRQIYKMGSEMENDTIIKDILTLVDEQ